MATKPWEVDIERHRGLAPKWYQNTYPSKGNKAHAGDGKNFSLIDPNVLTQGPGKSTLTNGDENGVVTTLIKGITRSAVTSGVGYAGGGALLHKLSSSTVSSGGSPSWPRTIDKAVVTGESIEDVAHYKAALFYSYNHSGSAGDVGRYDLASTFDDDYYSAAATGGADLTNNPHQLLVGGDDVLYITNGEFMDKLDGSTATNQALDFWADSVVASATWNWNRVVCAVNRPNISGANQNQSAVYKWDGYSPSWEGDPIEVEGRIGALLTKNGVTYIWYEVFEQGTARLMFGMLVGDKVAPIRSFDGTLPLFYQVGSIGNYIMWRSGAELMLWGPDDNESNVELQQHMTATGSTNHGGIAAPFGEILLASEGAASTFDLEKESGFATDGNWKSILYEPDKGALRVMVDYFELTTDKLASNAKVDIKLVDTLGVTLWSDEMSHTTDGAVTKKIFYPRAGGENLRLEYDWSNGNSTNPVKIRRSYLKGRTIPI